LCMAFGCTEIWSLHAQEVSETPLDPLQQAIVHIEQLKQGVLIVRLPSFRNQLRALDNRRNAAKQQQELLEDREHFARQIISAFRDTFRFCQTLYTYDTAMTLISEGHRSGFLLDDSLLVVNPDIAIPKGMPVYTLRLGITNYETTTRRTAFIFTDQQGNDLDKPFPFARSIFFLEPLNLKRMFGSSNFYRTMDARWARQIIGNIQARLVHFAGQVSAPGDG
jgi:hypothetical protein